MKDKNLPVDWNSEPQYNNTEALQVSTDYASLAKNTYHGSSPAQELKGGFVSEQNQLPESPSTDTQTAYNTSVGKGPEKGTFTK